MLCHLSATASVWLIVSFTWTLPKHNPISIKTPRHLCVTRKTSIIITGRNKKTTLEIRAPYCRCHTCDSRRLGPQTLWGDSSLSSQPHPRLLLAHRDWHSRPWRGRAGSPTYNSWLEGGLDFLLLQQDPVDLLEEWVLLDGIFPILCCHTAQALVGVLGHELWEEGSRELLRLPGMGHRNYLPHCFPHLCLYNRGLTPTVFHP